MTFKTKITIKVPVPKWKQKEEWGDYHIATALKREFLRKGYDVMIQTLFEWYNGEDSDCDVVIVLRGLNKYKTNPKQFNIMWNISHPDMVETEEYNSYDHVFIASELWARKISLEVNVPVDSLLQCSDTDLFYPETDDRYIHDLLFVGNSRKIFRTIIKDLLPTNKDLAVYGTNWEMFINKEYIKGHNIANNELRKAYSSCKILLNDHWEDMKKKGFVSNRIFDGFASGAFIISDRFEGLELFKDAIVTYDSSEELNQLIDYYLENDDERKKKASIGYEIVKKDHTFSKRVKDIIKVIESSKVNDIHLELVNLKPGHYMKNLWNKIISPVLSTTNPHKIVEIGYNESLIENSVEYCIENGSKLDVITTSNLIRLNYLNVKYPDLINVTSTPDNVSSEYDVLFIDANNSIDAIKSEIEGISNHIKNGKIPLIFIHSISCSDTVPIAEYRYNETVKYVEYALENSENELYYFKTSAYNGLIAISTKNHEEQLNILFNQNFQDDIEQERRVLSAAYHKTEDQIENLENKIIGQKIDLEMKEDEINSLKRSHFEKIMKMEDQFIKLIDEKSKERDTVNRLRHEKRELIDSLIQTQEHYHNLYMDFDRLTDSIIEMEYSIGKKRPLKQRILSKIPSIYILSKMHETGYKNALINVKGYRSIKKDGLLDIGFYLRKYHDVESSGQDPIIHYIYKGFKEGRQPNSNFDCEEYLKKRADVQNSKINPLVHYSLYGHKEGKKKFSSSEPYERRKKIGVKSFKRNKSSSGVRGGLNKSDETLIQGWLAKIGDNEPRTAILNIDGQTFETLSGLFRPDLKNNGINEGKHAFEFIVPLEYVDAKKHQVKLIDQETMKTISEQEFIWVQNRTYTDFTGFLNHSMISPLIRAPFGEEDKRCFAVMENVAKHLVKTSRNVDKLVSVIMPVYNRVDTVEAAISSVLKQSYENFELIIVDDGSDDGSNELIRNISDDRIVLKTNKECSGVSRARNIGLESAKGEYVMYLDSDNIWDPRYIAAMVGGFVEIEDADAIYSGQLLFKGDNEEPFAVRYGSYNKSLLYNRNYIDMNAFCHKKTVYETMGGFHEELRRYVDYDWIMNISSSFQIYSIPVLLSNYYYDKAENTITKDMQLVNHLDTVRERQKQRISKTNVQHESLKRKVSIIIPSYEALDDIKECLNTIYSVNTDDMLETIVVDNNSSDDVVRYLDEQAKHGKIKFIANKINYGFTYAVNQGIEISSKESDILILNNDAFLTLGAVETLQTAAHKLDDAGLVVPQQVLPGGTKTITEHVPYAYPNIECDVNLSAHHKNIDHVPIYHDGRILELKFAPFFCVYIKREILEASVGLDAEFGRHYRSDRIFCDYVRNLMKMKIYHIADAIVYHELQKATDQIRTDNDKKDEFDLMYIQNRWEPELAAELGFKNAKWDT